MSEIVTSKEVSDICGKAIGNLAFLRSCARCGEALSEEDETIIQTTIDELRMESDRIADLQRQLAEVKGEVERLTDLVRYQRGPLLEAELITQDEYQELLQIPGSVGRLHGYDNLRADSQRLREALEAIYAKTEIQSSAACLEIAAIAKQALKGGK